MKNWFFQQALSRASRLIGHPGRIIKLLTQLTMKLVHTDFRNLRAEHLLVKIRTLGRMASAYARGHYKDIPWKALLSVIAALLYFVNPLDLIPDVIPGLGLTDDFTVLLWVYASAEKEIEKFQVWEKGMMLKV